MGIDWEAFDKLGKEEQMEKFQDFILSKAANTFILENIDEIEKRFIFINKYLLLDHLPEGFYKKGFFAIDQFTHQQVALLLSKKEVAQNRPIESDVDEDFIHLRESLFSYRLRHPNLIQFYDSGMTDDEQRYIAYIYEEGRTLETLITNYSLNENQRTGILCQISKALEYIHKNGLVHGDVKPSNIIVTDKGISKLGDFGTVRTIEETIRLTGSISYTAPEVLEGESPTPAADVWSLGVLGYYLTYRKLPFKVEPEDWPDKLIEQIKTVEPKIDRNNRYLKALLEKNPKKRLQDGAACRRILDWKKEESQFNMFLFDLFHLSYRHLERLIYWNNFEFLGGNDEKKGS